MQKTERFEACILLGAIGDALGSHYENVVKENSNVYYLLGKPKESAKKWQITDDTQLTLVTLEAMIAHKTPNAEMIAQHFLQRYQQGIFSGLGASTLQAFRNLEAGGHWALVGRQGTYSAGNGTAMRIAPLAFCDNIARKTIREVCYLTHKNEEAYVGALAIFLAIQETLRGNWQGENNLLDLIIPQLPDTKVKDRLIQINHFDDLEEIGNLGNDGYIVNSVPLALASANQIDKINIEDIFETLIKVGGDTDTNCSMTGQLVGTLLGKDKIPENYLQKLQTISAFDWIESTIRDFKDYLV